MICPPSGDLPNLGIKPRCPGLRADSLPSEPPGKPKNTGLGSSSGELPDPGIKLGSLALQVDSLLSELPGKPVRLNQFNSVQFSHSVVSDSCDPMNRSTPGLPVHHQLPEFTQTHVHRVGDAAQPSHPLSSPSPPAPNPSQHQGLFQ